ncbi:hypothetical protein GCM10007377_11450 [Galliscardovia ingluviei]|uniref:Ribosome maturation factor RimM n=1 Tax=Galliscardovia ingluviei TaxID=1769422 RepID=A0A8J3F2I9_9BIFI|nr:ribosome maturation factor RimM [Galliscardovia ingluviei]GGI14541.1 hypothetical protein GCM10007377_11450 [Galliscardovia ingluviei]
MAQQQDLMRVCRIGRAQGLKGEVNVMVTTDSPEQRFAPGSVLLTQNGGSMTVASSRKFKQRWIIHFEGVDDRNASEALKGLELFVEPDHEIARTGDSQGHSELRAETGGEFADGTEFTDGADSDVLADSTDFEDVVDADAIEEDGAGDEGAGDEDEGFYAEELMHLQVRIPHDTAEPEGEYDVAGTVIDVTESPAQWLLTVQEPSGAESLVPFVDAFIPVIDVEEGYLVLTPPNGLLQDR